MGRFRYVCRCVVKILSDNSTNRLTSGVLARGFQLGILRRPWGHFKMGYVYSAALWTGIGYFFYKVVDAEDEILNERVKKLHEARARRKQEAAVPAAEN